MSSSIASALTSLAHRLSDSRIQKRPVILHEKVLSVTTHLPSARTISLHTSQLTACPSTLLFRCH
jgi:hypothetical protein